METSTTPSWLNSLLSEPEEIQRQFLLSLPETMKERALAVLAGWRPKWTPLPGPQTQAYQSPADVLLYGGAAGGGKTDLLLGLARYEHRRSIIFRRVYPSLRAIVDRSREIYSPIVVTSFADSFNESLHQWRFSDGCRVRFGAIQYDTDVGNYQGQPHDLYGWDELTEFTEKQFRFVIGWNRTTDPKRRCRIVGTGNPPTTAEGEWVIRYWAPWLDQSHSNPAKPGELRWFTTIDGKDIEVESGKPFEFSRPSGVKELVVPLSRTFIPSRITDNPHLLKTGYVATLQALPEPLRSKMLHGDFTAWREDDAYQVIPSEWVHLAQLRWKQREKPTTPMSALGVDVARGGRDRTVLTPRYDNWVDEQTAIPGAATPDGPAVAAQVIKHRSDNAIVNVDIIGVGGSVYDCLRPVMAERVVAMNASEGSCKRDKSGQLGFVNQRAEWWWIMREALDPASGQDMALPPDPELKADLCAPTWKLTARGIQIELKEDLTKRLGRSPDKGDSCVYACAVKVIPGTGLLEVAREEIAAKREADKQK